MLIKFIIKFFGLYWNNRNSDANFKVLSQESSKSKIEIFHSYIVPFLRLHNLLSGTRGVKCKLKIKEKYWYRKKCTFQRNVLNINPLKYEIYILKITVFYNSVNFTHDCLKYTDQCVNSTFSSVKFKDKTGKRLLKL